MKMRDCKVRKWLSALLALILLSSVLPISAGASQVYAGGFSAVVYSGDVAVYSDASLTNRIGTLDQTTVVTVNAFSGGVAHISTWYGASGFVDASALRTVEELAQPAIIRYDTRVYQQPSTSSTSGALSAGSTVNFLGAAGDWALIERGGIGGFTYVGALYVEGQDPEPTATPAPTQPSGGNYIPGTVTAISCPIYARNSTSSSQIGSLPSNTQLNVYAVSGGWAYIEWNGNYGFCQVSNLIPTQSLETYMDGTVVSAAPVYSGASTSSTYYGQMSVGTQVTVYSISSGWAFIRMGDYYGYCRVSNLTPGHVSTDPTPTPAPTATQPSGGNYIPGTVIAISCPIYASNSTGSTQIGTLPSNTQLNVYAVSGGWAYIEWNGNYGFCQVSNHSEIARGNLHGWNGRFGGAGVLGREHVEHLLRRYAGGHAGDRVLDFERLGVYPDGRLLRLLPRVEPDAGSRRHRSHADALAHGDAGQWHLHPRHRHREAA